MNDILELKGILKYIFKILNLKSVNIKDLTNILFLIEWEFIKISKYRLFNYKWTNSLENNINLIRNDIKKCNLEIISHNRYEMIYYCESDYKLTNYINKSIEKIKDYELILNKSEFYFLDKLPFDLFYKNDKLEFINIDIEELVRKKENKEY